MSTIEIILTAALISFGLYTTFLLLKLEDIMEQQEQQVEAIIGMALELSELGSPNVTIQRKDANKIPD